MAAAGLAIMFLDTLLSLFQPSLQFPHVAVCAPGPFSCFCALCHRSLSFLSTSLKISFSFYCDGVLLVLQHYMKLGCVGVEDDITGNLVLDKSQLH